MLSDPILMCAILGISILLILFIIYPLLMLVGESFDVEKGHSLFQNYINVFRMSSFLTALGNTMVIGIISSILSTIV